MGEEKSWYNFKNRNMYMSSIKVFYNISNDNQYNFSKKSIIQHLKFESKVLSGFKKLFKNKYFNSKNILLTFFIQFCPEIHSTHVTYITLTDFIFQTILTITKTSVLLWLNISYSFISLRINFKLINYSLESLLFSFDKVISYVALTSL